MATRINTIDDVNARIEKAKSQMEKLKMRKQELEQKEQLKQLRIMQDVEFKKKIIWGDALIKVFDSKNVATEDKEYIFSIITKYITDDKDRQILGLKPLPKK